VTPSWRPTAIARRGSPSRSLRQPAGQLHLAHRPEFGWLLRLLEQHGERPSRWAPTLGGTAALWVFTDTLGIPVAVDPAANSDNPAARLTNTTCCATPKKKTALYADVVGSRPA